MCIKLKKHLSDPVISHLNFFSMGFFNRLQNAKVTFKYLFKN